MRRVVPWCEALTTAVGVPRLPRTMRRNLAALAVVLAAVLATGARASAQRHPHFDDRGTLAWQTKLADGQRAARQADKILLVEVGAKT